MFYIHFDENDTAKVFDTDDFSVESLPGQVARNFIRDMNAQVKKVDTNFDVLHSGEYALLYKYTKVGNRIHTSGILFRQGSTTTGVLEVKASDWAVPKLSPYMLGCIIELETVVNGIRYTCNRKFDDYLNMIDATNWMRKR